MEVAVVTKEEIDGKLDELISLGLYKMIAQRKHELELYLAEIKPIDPQPIPNPCGCNVMNCPHRSFGR